MHPTLIAIAPWALAALTVQLAVDAWLGPRAEYFNAWYVLRTLGGAADLPYIFGRAALGRWALPLATVVLVAQPTLYGSLARWGFQRLGGERRPAARGAAVGGDLQRDHRPYPVRLDGVEP